MAFDSKRWSLSDIGVLQMDYPSGPPCAWHHVKAVDYDWKRKIWILWFLVIFELILWQFLLWYQFFALVAVFAHGGMSMAARCVRFRADELSMAASSEIWHVCPNCVASPGFCSPWQSDCLQSLSIDICVCICCCQKVRLLCNACMCAVAVSVC